MEYTDNRNDNLAIAERNICGHILRGHTDDIGRLKASDFIYMTDLFMAITELNEKGTLFKDDFADIKTLADMTPASITIGQIAAMMNTDRLQYCAGLAILFEEAKVRPLTLAANGKLSADEAVKRANDALERSTGFTGRELTHYYEDFLGFLEALSHDTAEKYSPGGKIAKLVPQFRKGELITIAARPQVGKSAYALQIAVDAALKGFRVLYFSLEMSKEVMGKRTTQLLHPIDASLFDDPKQLGKDDWTLLYKTYDEIQNLNVIDNLRSMSQIEAAVKNLNPDIIVIDQLTLISADSSRWDARTTMSNATKKAKQIAMDAGITVVALTQINRAAATQEPELHHLKESGSIEEDSDVVIMLHRLSDEECEKYRQFPYDLDYLRDHGELPSIIKVAKNRNGQTGTVPMLFEGRRYRYIEPYLDMYKSK